MGKNDRSARLESAPAKKRRWWMPTLARRGGDDKDKDKDRTTRLLLLLLLLVLPRPLLSHSNVSARERE